MRATVVYCDADDYGLCRRCDAEVWAPNQVCFGADNLDDIWELDEPLTRRDWRVLLRAAERECYYLVRRTKRATSEPNGSDARALECLRRLVPVLARAAGDEPKFV